MTDNNLPDYDLIIVGGGMVGASLACALGHSGLRIAVIEARPFESEQQPSFDARTVALAYGSKQIFAAMGLWSAIQQLGVTPIKHIHVSDRGHAGSTHLHHQEHQVDALGYVVETRVIGQVLNDTLAQLDNVELICPAQVQNISFSQAVATVEIEQDKQPRSLTAKLLVAADGGNSQVRDISGIKTINLDYGQSAVIANVASDRPHQHIAYERFTNTGPMALLPAHDSQGGDNLFALVWTVQHKQADKVMALDDEAFLSQLQQRFGDRAGHFIKVGARHVYPLSLLQSREHVRPHLAIIGNAAHTLHPVAGQGFNLGLRDVAVLAQVIVDGVRNGLQPGDMQLLRDYASWRRRDHLQAAAITDGLVRGFSSAFPPLALARNVGLALMDVMPPLKRIMARRAMGYIGKLPRLARGLPL